MEKSIRKDAYISFWVGIIAGALFLPIMGNLGISFNFLTILVAIPGLAILTTGGYLAGLFLSRWIPAMLQFVKFGIVGGLNFLIDLGVLNLLIFLSGIAVGYFYSLFKAVSFLVAVINSYFWNKYWTFRASDGPHTIEFAKFFTINVIGFGINVSAASFVVNVIGAPAGFSGEVWANIGAAAAAIVALMWNFIGMKFVVFKK